MKILLLPLLVLTLTACNEHKKSNSKENNVTQPAKPGSVNNGAGYADVVHGIPKGIYNGNNFNLLNENEGLITVKGDDGKALYAALSVKADDVNGKSVKTGSDISCREEFCTLTIEAKDGLVTKAMNPGKAPKIDKRMKKSYDSENLHLERSVLGIGNNGLIKLSGLDAETLFNSINLAGVDSTKKGNALITKKTRDLKCVKTTEKETEKESFSCELKFRQRNGEIIQNKID